MRIKMLKSVPVKTENLENHQCGIEGLAVAVIALAVSDLGRKDNHARTAIYFFKNAPKLLEFWLATATYQGRRNMDLEIAQKYLYEQACAAEKVLGASYRKKSGKARLVKKVAERQK